MTDVLDHLSLLADPVRARILAVLAAEEVTVGELARVLQMPQSTVSRHVKALQAAGWIDRRTVGTASHLALAGDLPEAALWEALYPRITASTRHREDGARLAAVLAARTPSSEDFFGRIRAGWDAVRSELFGETWVLPTSLALLPPEWTIGDLGCGTGTTVAALAPAVHRVIGVDREARMLEVARRQVAGLDNVDLYEGALTALPLPDGILDVALCTLVLHHVPDLACAFREIARVLRPGGRAVVVDMQRHDRTAYRRTMGHVHLGFARDTLEPLASAAGLAVHRWQALDPDPDAQGPPLFLATFRTQAT